MFFVHPVVVLMSNRVIGVSEAPSSNLWVFINTRSKAALLNRFRSNFTGIALTLDETTLDECLFCFLQFLKGVGPVCFPYRRYTVTLLHFIPIFPTFTKTNVVVKCMKTTNDGFVIAPFIC